MSVFDRSIQLSVDTSSWGGAPPQEFLRLGGSFNFDLRNALAVLAIATRPPFIHGFHLSDCWAFLRYGPAFQRDLGLRLREEWEEIDPHQKAILSDEVAVGLTLLLLQRTLAFSYLADTLHFVRKLGGTPNGRRVGSRKLADFVAWREITSGLLIIECKGTQTRKSLRSAMDRGREQKANTAQRLSALVEHSVVAGLYIPRASARDQAEVQLIDPPGPPELEFTAAPRSPTEIKAALGEIYLAKMLALLGWAGEAHLLTDNRLDDETAADRFRDSLRRRIDLGRFSARLAPPIRPLTEEGGALYPTGLTVTADPKVLHALAEAGDRLTLLASEHVEGWRIPGDGEFDDRTLFLPLGFEVSLETEGNWENIG